MGAPGSPNDNGCCRSGDPLQGSLFRLQRKEVDSQTKGKKTIIKKWGEYPEKKQVHQERQSKCPEKWKKEIMALPEAKERTFSEVQRKGENVKCFREEPTGSRNQVYFPWRWQTGSFRSKRSGCKGSWGPVTVKKEAHGWQTPARLTP